MDNYPLVSITTITFNRRPFIPYLIKCIEEQEYPKNKLEWIVIDDGSDNISDIIELYKKKVNFSIKYFRYEERMNISKKRNISHTKCEGSIIVYFDDDDFYPPTRVIHSVETLRFNPYFLIAGSSAMYIYFKHLNELYIFGPYGKYHSTAATFAFKKELLEITQYDENDLLAEEKNFLKNYTIPLIQLDPKKTILVVSHVHNSLDKKTLLENNSGPKIYKLQDINLINNIIKNKNLRDFYCVNLNNVLEKYTDGDNSHKKEIIDAIKEGKEKREKLIEENNKLKNQYTELVSQHIKHEELDICELREYYEKIIDKKTLIITKLLKTVSELKSELEVIKTTQK